MKVQRPGIAVQVDRDLALLATVARRFERYQPGAVAFRPAEAVAELARYTRRELDFRREARTAERLRQLLAGDDRIVIPAVITSRSSGRVLTTAFVDGLPPGPPPVRGGPGSTPKQCCARAPRGPPAPRRQ